VDVVCALSNPLRKEDTMITLDQAKKLVPGTVLFLDTFNKQGKPHKCRVSGKPKVWVRSPNKVKVPVKAGLYENGYITEDTLDRYYLTEEEAQAKLGTVHYTKLDRFDYRTGRIYRTWERTEEAPAPVE
jgi:hypothetical protein